jgi:hypothetical protein
MWIVGLGKFCSCACCFGPRVGRYSKYRRSILLQRLYVIRLAELSRVFDVTNRRYYMSVVTPHCGSPGRVSPSICNFNERCTGLVATVLHSIYQETMVCITVRGGDPSQTLGGSVSNKQIIGGLNYVNINSQIGGLEPLEP